jgi:hypothetical protein
MHFVTLQMYTYILYLLLIVLHQPHIAKKGSKGQNLSNMIRWPVSHRTSGTLLGSISEAQFTRQKFNTPDTSPRENLAYSRSYNITYVQNRTNKGTFYYINSLFVGGDLLLIKKVKIFCHFSAWNFHSPQSKTGLVNFNPQKGHIIH